MKRRLTLALCLLLCAAWLLPVCPSLAAEQGLDAYAENGLRVLEWGINATQPYITVSGAGRDGGYVVENTAPGTTVQIRSVAFGDLGAARAHLYGNSGMEDGYTIELRADSPSGVLLCTFDSDRPTDGGWSEGADRVAASASLSTPVTGVRTLYLVYVRGSFNFFGLSFEEERPPVSPVYRRGDVTGDGQINSSDARQVLQYTVSAITLEKAALTAADANGDGAVNSSDARQILQMAVGGEDDDTQEVPPGQITTAVSPQNEYYLSPDGSDWNPGTKEQPLRSLPYVTEVLRHFKDQVEGDITVVLAGGTYPLTDTWELNGDELNKADGGRIRFLAAKGETPIISGGKQVTGWTRTTVNGIDGIYKAQVNGVAHVRQFYVGNQAQQRATYGKPVYWEWTAERTGLKLRDIDLSALTDASTAEIVWPVTWKIFLLQCASVSGDRLYFDEPYWSDFVDMIDTMVASGQSEEFYPVPEYPLYLYNDLSFLDEPGEWFYDEAAGELYYYPAAGVDLQQDSFYIPVVEEMLSLSGVENLSFEGITFRYGAWNGPSEEGLIINQAQNYMVITRQADGGVTVGYDQLPANITAENVRSLRFTGCTFEDMGATALSLFSGVQDSVVEGCVFTQCAEGGLVLSNDKAHTVTAQTICQNNQIDNNVFWKVGLDYWSAPALAVYYAAGTTITHNDIYDVPYSGITLGWGWYWTPNSTTGRQNVVRYNRIGKFLQRTRDGGGIYTLGQQPDSLVQYNYIFDQGAAYGGLYHDEGSAHFETSYNVVDNLYTGTDDVNWIHVNGKDGGPNGGKTTYDIAVHDNWHSNPKTSLWGDPVTVVVWDNPLVENGEWPAEALTVMEEAGLTADWEFLLDRF